MQQQFGTLIWPGIVTGTGKDTAAISEVCQRRPQDNIQCDPDAA